MPLFNLGSIVIIDKVVLCTYWFCIVILYIASIVQTRQHASVAINPKKSKCSGDLEVCCKEEVIITLFLLYIL